MILSLGCIVDDLMPVFTQPSYTTTCELLLSWVLCLGRHTLRRVGQTAHPEVVPDHSRRHGLDRYYNYFARSAWTPKALAYRVALLVFTRLKLLGTITLLVDDTLAHKRGKSVWGLGWFRDACASTKKRVATAPGHNWVVLAVAVCLPGTGVPILALPLVARLHRPGKGQPSCPALAQQMLAEVLDWFPGRRFTLVGDGAYACKELLKDLDERVAFVGRIRGDAALFDPRVPKAKPGQPGPKPQKGPKPREPREAAPWVWSMQSVIMVWYVTAGQTLPEAKALRERMGDWDSEWSLRHMIQVLRCAILNATINPNSADEAELRDMVETLKKWANLAA